MALEAPGGAVTVAVGLADGVLDGLLDELPQPALSASGAAAARPEEAATAAGSAHDRL